MELWTLKYKYLYYKYNFLDLCKRKCLCSFGFHQVIPGSESILNHKKEELTTEYVRCRNCNIHFFPTKEHKDSYLRIRESRNQMHKNMLETYKEMYDSMSE
jgi:hypothetical protein